MVFKCANNNPVCLQKDEFLRLAINAIHNDLISRNEAFQSLALTFVANSEQQARWHTLSSCMMHSSEVCTRLMCGAALYNNQGTRQCLRLYAGLLSYQPAELNKVAPDKAAAAAER